MGSPVLEIRNVSVGAEPAFCRDVSFAVDAGEAVAVLGGEGAGKSQLLRCIGLELAPSSGSVLLDGIEVTGATGLDRNELKGRAIELVHPPSSPDADSATDTAGSSAVSRRPTATMPVTWMRQRIQIARAVTQATAALLLDEPFAGIDHGVRVRIEELLHRARREAGTAVVVATRDTSVARHVADRVVVLHQGEVVESGPTDGVLDAPSDARTRALVTVRRSA